MPPKPVEIDINDLRYRHPFTCMVAGPTMSGKTVHIKDMLKHYKETISGIDELKVLWAQGQWQPSYEKEETYEIEYFEGLPSQKEIAEKNINLLVIDDLMLELDKDPQLANLFTKGSHHLNLSVILVVQNIFHQGKFMRTIGTNSHYYTLMQSARTLRQIITLGSQLYPKGKGKFLEQAYLNATEDKNFGHFRIDFHPRTPNKLRIATNLIPNPDFRPIVYIPKWLV